MPSTLRPRAYLEGLQTPIFFGGAINSFGLKELLHHFVRQAPKPQERDALTRTVTPMSPSSPALARFGR